MFVSISFRLQCMTKCGFLFVDSRWVIFASKATVTAGLFTFISCVSIVIWWVRKFLKVLPCEHQFSMCSCSISDPGAAFVTTHCFCWLQAEQVSDPQYPEVLVSTSNQFALYRMGIQYSWGSYTRKRRAVRDQSIRSENPDGLPFDWYLAPDFRQSNQSTL